MNPQTRTISALVALGGLLSVAQIASEVNFSVMQQPHYFSGTNCREMGSGNLDKPAGEVDIVDFKMQIRSGGDMAEIPGIFKRDRSGRAELSSSFAIFDSSHFPNGSNVEVQLFAKAKYQDGHTDAYWQTSTTIAAVVKNRSAVAGTSVSPFGLPFTDPATGSSTTVCKLFVEGFQTHLAAANYSSNWTAYNTLWTKSQLLSGSMPCNVLSVLAHGNPTQAQIYDNASGVQSGCFPVDWSELHAAKSIAVGSGSPPYNSSGIPPFNLVFLMSCRQGNFFEWAATLIPGYPNLQNQAVLGFNCYVTSICAADMPSGFTQLLTAGFTLKLAADNYADGSHDYYCSDSPGSDGAGTGAQLRELRSLDVSIYGDPATTIHGVYTGDPTAVSTAWYR